MNDCRLGAEPGSLRTSEVAGTAREFRRWGGIVIASIALVAMAVMVCGPMTPLAAAGTDEAGKGSTCLLSARDGTPCVGVELDEHGQPRLWLKSTAGGKISLGFDKAGEPAITLVDSKGKEALTAAVTGEGAANLVLRQPGNKPFAQIGQSDAKTGPVFQLYDADGKPFIVYKPKSKWNRSLLLLDPPGRERISFGVCARENMNDAYLASIGLTDQQGRMLMFLGVHESPVLTVYDGDGRGCALSPLGYREEGP